MSSFSGGRRLLLTLFAIAVAAVLLRTQVSSALVTRADSLAYWGHREQARILYRRALFFDPRNGVAADRYAFDAAISRERTVVRSGILVASRYLMQSPDDAGVLMDRALCYQHLHDLRRAIDDFERAASVTHDARALLFAALDERMLNHVDSARMLLRRATRFDPTFIPVLRDIARS